MDVERLVILVGLIITMVMLLLVEVVRGLVSMMLLLVAMVQCLVTMVLLLLLLLVSSSMGRVVVLVVMMRLLFVVVVMVVVTVLLLMLLQLLVSRMLNLVGMGVQLLVQVKLLVLDACPLVIVRVVAIGAGLLLGPPLARRLHLEVGAHAVVLGVAVAEVDHAALIGALVGRLDVGEAQLVGDVAARHLHHLG